MYSSGECGRNEDCRELEEESFVHCHNIIIVSYFSYVRYKIIIDRIENEVSVSANQVENVFIDYSNISEMLLMHMYHQMLTSDDIFRVNVKIAKILTTFNQDTKIINSLGNNLISGAMFYWIDSKKNLIASSSGLVSKAINLSSRDYLQKTEKNPMHIQIGSPVIGALSGKSIIPMALGVNNLDGDFVGSIVLSLQLENLHLRNQRPAQSALAWCGPACLGERNRIAREEARR